MKKKKKKILDVLLVIQTLMNILCQKNKLASFSSFFLFFHGTFKIEKSGKKEREREREREIEAISFCCCNKLNV